MEMNYFELRDLTRASRGNLARLIDTALLGKTITQKERDVLYMRHVDWFSLAKIGELRGVTRERIRQIEAKAEEKIRLYEKTYSKAQ